MIFKSIAHKIVNNMLIYLATMRLKVSILVLGLISYCFNLLLSKV